MLITETNQIEFLVMQLFTFYKRLNQQKKLMGGRASQNMLICNILKPAEEKRRKRKEKGGNTLELIVASPFASEPNCTASLKIIRPNQV